MTQIKGIRASGSTISRPGFQERSGGYKWRGIPDWSPGDVRFADPAVRRPKSRDMSSLYAGKAERLAEFKRLIEEEKLTAAEAGERIGIARQTVRTYARDLRIQKQQEASQP